METNNKFLDRRAILGILLVGLGILFLTENLGWLTFSVHNILFSFPMLLILIGVIGLNHRGNNGFSYILIFVGAFLLFPRIFNIPFDYSRIFWPAILVILGLLILFRKKKDHHFCRPEVKESPSDYLDAVHIFGGCERKIISKNFRGGKITSIFGGASLDMTECELGDGKNILDIVNIFGGTKMIVPADWKVHVEVISILGGFADKRRTFNTAINTTGKELHITGIVIFGGGEIKNF
jgi:predicted membrane protein